MGRSLSRMPLDQVEVDRCAPIRAPDSRPQLVPKERAGQRNRIHRLVEQTPCGAHTSELWRSVAVTELGSQQVETLETKEPFVDPIPRGRS